MLTKIIILMTLNFLCPERSCLPPKDRYSLIIYKSKWCFKSMHVKAYDVATPRT